ncbi:uncharacterized protein N7483_009906 [Penicillium malachiteum]|uniref:uncharacterized protein n=1 Tax=Penicillium malachiteum TaxID=1324776 RepID=UPI0025487A18|nr:uncharacterized protein N7483_009906 [Penicillium malachiteum]KAJ5718824.1 hypothetical protein N7483_009906 [Penicillium malachiteum]
MSMSFELQSSLHERSVDRSLQNIDDGSKEEQLPPGHGNFIGPFGVLSLSQSTNPPIAGTSPKRTNYVPAQGSHLLEATILRPLPSRIPDLNSDLHNIEPSLNWPDLFDISLSWADLNFDTFRDQSLDALVMRDDLENSYKTLRVADLADSFSSEFTLGNVEISEAQMLLRRYKDTIVAQLFSLPLYKMSPWEEINVDTAVLIMGRISYMGVERVSNAAIANLLALIAISAADMAAEMRKSGTEGSEHWENISAASYARGKAHLQKSLDETQNMPPPKYKEQMMAISAMLSFSKRQGHISSTPNVSCVSVVYGGGAEMVIIELLTPKTSPAEGPRDLPGSSHSSSNPKVQLDDFLRLDDELVDSEIEDGKNNGGVLNAMHIENSGESTRAMYHQLYGFSETWLSLVSKTTRLADILDKLKLRSSPQKSRILQPLESYKPHLEELIWERVKKMNLLNTPQTAYQYSRLIGNRALSKAHPGTPLHTWFMR